MFLYTTIRETIRWKTHTPQHSHRVVLILPVCRFRKRRSTLLLNKRSSLISTKERTDSDFQHNTVYQSIRGFVFDRGIKYEDIEEQHAG